MTGDRDDAAIEIEATLRIQHTTAEALTDEVVGWGRLGDLILQLRSPLCITDCYLDLADGALRRAGFAFRRRRVEAGSSVHRKITLKGLARRERGLGIERFELEREEGPRARDEIRRVLIDHGVALPADPAGGNPSLGLETIQERTTLRRRVHGIEGGVARVEMCLDTVRFGVGDRVIVHEELEIEALTGGDAGTVDEVGRELLRRLPDQLAPWSYSKLEVGQGLARLEVADGLRDLGPDGRLDAGGYGRLERILSGAPDTDTHLAGG